MNKLLQLLLNKTIMKKIKAWLTENGFMGFVALAIAGGAMFLGMWMIFAGSIGFFLGKNWEIIRKLWNESKLKDKIEDVVDDVKEKIS